MSANDNESAPAASTLTAIFADVKAADLAARSLIALGMTEDQVQIVDLPRLIVEFNPKLVNQITGDATAAKLSDLDDELIENLGQRIASAVDLTNYLTEAGLTEHDAAYYEGKIRAGYVLLVADPQADQLTEAKRLLNHMGLGNT